ncbi:hypothetical protein [Variovorax sp. efr-133-TYG-130]|uniref:hypothetical protein n=1 Tax=Variovorax sp. efr-133-TYG-130 TaxID=3040327 RepID=UPI002556EEDB|nr:hypothetical protein [Variovorax sp. efr-133-TYG-130]
MKTMKHVPPQIERLKSWPGIERYLVNEAEWQKLHQDNQRKILEGYVSRGIIAFVSPETGENEAVVQPFKSHLGPPLWMSAKSRVITGTSFAASGRDARDVFANAVLYQELASLRDFLNESEFPARHGRKLGMFGIWNAGWLGLAAGLGVMEVTARFAPLLIRAAHQEYFRLDAKSRGMQHWILRLWCRVHGLSYPNTGYPHYDVAEGILEMWDTQDLEMLGAWLVQLCNLHTRLAVHRENMDFANSFSHFPIEVLMLFRLREQAGLANPTVDHPIMKFPWSCLWPIKPAEPDELLAGVYRRLEADEGVTVAGLYRQLLSA